MRLASTSPLLLLTLGLLDHVVAAPTNFATSRYEGRRDSVQAEKAQDHILVKKRSFTLARTRNLAALQSGSPASNSTGTSTPASKESSTSTQEDESSTSSSNPSSSSSSSSNANTSTLGLSRSESTSSSSTQPTSSSSATPSQSSTSSTSSSSGTSSTPTSISTSTSIYTSTTSSSSSSTPSSSSSSPSSNAESSTSPSSSSVSSSAPSTSSSTAASSTIISTSSSSDAAVPTGNAMAGCSCGYKLSSFNDLYLRKSYSIDFTKYSSVSQLSSAGMFVADGYQIGNTAPDGTYVYASSNNVKFGSDGVHLVVPGNQTAGGKVTGAQLIFNNNGKGMTRMYAEAEIQVDATPGTCQAFWTYTVDQSKTSDEQDMEVIAASLLEDSDVKEAGLQLTNHSPDNSNDKDHRTVPFPTDPSVGFHKYTIAWDRSSVSYSFDDQVLDGPTDYVSQNPSNLLFNNWGSGNIGFMGAPLPTTDVTMRIKSMRVWYETDFVSSLPSGCTEANVCTV